MGCRAPSKEECPRAPARWPALGLSNPFCKEQSGLSGFPAGRWGRPRTWGAQPQPLFWLPRAAEPHCRPCSWLWGGRCRDREVRPRSWQDWPLLRCAVWGHSGSCVSSRVRMLAVTFQAQLWPPWFWVQPRGQGFWLSPPGWGAAVWCHLRSSGGARPAAGRVGAGVSSIFSGPGGARA